MRVKICGVTNLEDVRAVVRCGADFVGLILAAGPRSVDLATAALLAAAVVPPVEPVLVFRGATVDEILDAVARTGCKWVQLHGNEDLALLEKLRARQPDLHIIKGWEVAHIEDGDWLAQYLHRAAEARVQIDAVILDSPKGGSHPGYPVLGEVSRRCAQRPPQVWCAGGLTPENLRTAVAWGSYDGVDVARGVELRPGVKSHAAVARFIHAAKALGQNPPTLGGSQ